MPVTLTWRPKKIEKDLYLSGGPAFVGILEKAFGSMPIVLDGSNLDTLRGIVACNEYEADKIIDLICIHGSIEIDTEDTQ